MAAGSITLRSQECVIGLRSIVLPGASLRHVVMMGADFYETEEERAENRRLSPAPHGHWPRHAHRAGDH